MVLQKKYTRCKSCFETRHDIVGPEDIDWLVHKFLSVRLTFLASRWAHNTFLPVTLFWLHGGRVGADRHEGFGCCRARARPTDNRSIAPSNVATPPWPASRPARFHMNVPSTSGGRSSTATPCRDEPKCACMVVTPPPWRSDARVAWRTRCWTTWTKGVQTKHRATSARISCTCSVMGNRGDPR